MSSFWCLKRTLSLSSRFRFLLAARKVRAAARLMRKLVQANR